MIDVTVAPNGVVSFSCQAAELPAVLDALREGAPSAASTARFVETAKQASAAKAKAASKGGAPSKNETEPAAAKQAATKAEAAATIESVAAPAEAFGFEKSTRDHIIDLKTDGFFMATQSSKDIAAALQAKGVDASQNQVCAALSTMLKKSEIKRTDARPYRYHA